MSQASQLFQNSTLYMSLRSPFARRVRLALLENGVSFKEVVCDVFHPTEELLRVNPLARVPAVKLASGDVIIDSNYILNLFYKDSNSELYPETQEQLQQMLYWSSLAVGLAEKVVEFYLETLRPAEKRDEEIFSEYRAIKTRVIAQLEKHLSEKERVPGGAIFIAQKLTQADLDFGTALTYLSLRDSTKWRDEAPTCASYLDQLEAREHFRKTKPSV